MGQFKVLSEESNPLLITFAQGKLLQLSVSRGNIITVMEAPTAVELVRHFHLDTLLNQGCLYSSP